MKSETNINLAQLAKQGNPKAIETLLNKQIEPKGITAKVDFKANCLQILLESDKLLPQDVTVKFFRNSFTKLGSTVIKTIKIYAKQSGEAFFIWHDSFDLIEELSTDNLIETARKGNIESIAHLINNWLQAERITAKVNLKDGCLRVMLEAEEVPNQESIVSTITNELHKLSINDITKLVVYCKQINEDFPAWHEEINYDSLNNNLKPIVESLALISVNENDSHKIINASLTQVNSIDAVNLSNYLYYDFLQIKIYEPLLIRSKSEEEKNKIHDIVNAFNISNLEEDVKLSIRQVERQIVQNLEDNFNLTLDVNEVQRIFYDIYNYKFSNLRNAIREMEEAIREVLNFDFPEETDELKAFFKEGTKNFMDGFLGTVPTEAAVGVILGNIVMPGLGGVIGGAVGGWFAGNNKQKQYQKIMEEILNKYDAAKNKINDCFQSLFHNCYEEISNLIYKSYQINLITCEDFTASENLFYQGNVCFDAQKFTEAINFYDQAIALNSHHYVAWYKKGYVLLLLKQYEQSINAFDESLKINNHYDSALTMKILVLRFLEQYQTVILLSTNAIDAGCINFEILYEKAFALHKTKRYLRAIKTCDKAISNYYHHPQIYTIFVLKSAALVNMEKSGLALENLRKAVSLNPEKSQNLIANSPSFENLRNDPRFIALMESSVGIDYSNLKRLLSEGKWKQADTETATLLCLAVTNNEKKINIISESNTTHYTWLSCEHLINIPPRDLNTINSLWLTYSNGKFGFSVQKEIYQGFGGTQEFNGEIRDKFGIAVGWRIKDKDGNYFWRRSEDCYYLLKDAPKGHLPSCLWAGVNDGLFETRRDRLIKLFYHLETDKTTS
jgi:tetratricopeptide (TPR) repeat protein